jgi:signal transduction histidine kinase
MNGKRPQLDMRRLRWAARAALPWRRKRESDPSAAMFAGIRRRLTLWYSGVLAAILLLAGVLLFVGVRAALLNPVTGYLTDSAQQISAAWQTPPPDAQPGSHAPSCHVPRSAVVHVPYIACYGPLGVGLLHDPLIVVPLAFQDPSLARAALASPSGQATDTITAENGLGAIQRYALVVRDPQDKSLIGVVQVGVPVEGQLTALRVLLVLLLLVGALTLGGAMVGGTFLSSRALAPARLAFTRQQAFIADASHELRTPLTLMRADAEVLLRGRDRLPSDDAALLDDIVNETAHMGALATNMLTLARLDAGGLHLEHDIVDLGEVASGAIRRVQALADERHITLDILDIAASADHALVIGDRAALEQATLILIDNAIKYNRPDGTVSVHTFLDGRQAHLEVRDTGVGISAEHLPRLGERFYRVDKARSREAGGAGLGLSIAHGIAAALGGTLALRSVPDEGTTATLTLPAATGTAR